MTNGESSGSKTLSHLSSLPAVSEGIETFRSNPYGKKSIDLVDSAYSRFGKPVEGYLETPYSYAKPYVSKADELGDRALGTVKDRFPIVKEDSGTIYNTAMGYAFWPYDYVSAAWNEEYTRTARHNNRGEGMSTLVMALVSTQLRIISDSLAVVADFVRPRYEESKKKSGDYVRVAQDKAQEVAGAAQERLGQFQQQGQEAADKAQEKAGQYQKQGQETADQAKASAQKGADQARESARSIKEEAQKKASQ